MTQGLAAIRRIRRRLLIWAVLAILLGLGLGFVPLFGVLGYENALALALVGGVCSLDVGAALARSLQQMPAPGLARATYPGRMIAASAAHAAAVPVANVALPALISAVRGIWVPTCDWWFGVKAWLLMPALSAALGGVLGLAIGLAVGVRARDSWVPHRSTVLAVLAWPVLLLFALWRFYGAPAVFSYTPLVGYFPGNLYDENVRLGAPVVWARLEQLLWLVAILAAVAMRLDVPAMRVTRSPRPVGRRLRPLALLIACAVPATLMHGSGGALGYNITASDIEDVLDGRIETAHFVIHYARTPEIEKDIKLIAEDHELRYAQVVKTLGMAPPGKLESFLFADRDQKGRWMGARDVEMAKPWRQEIYLDHRPFPHTSLRHEIAHAVASSFGDPIFGVAARRVFGIPVLFSPGLIEGLAVAVDWPGGSYDRMTPHEAVRALQLMGKRPSIAQLLSLQFFTFSSAAGYTTAGSFLRFLLDTYGAPRLRAVYRNGGDFEDAYGKPLRTLEGEWVGFISSISLSPEAVDAQRERFRGGSVFDRPCPHAIAKTRHEAARASVMGEQKRAIELMRDVCADAPEEPRYQIDLGEMLIGGDLMQKAEAIGRWENVARDVEHVTSSLRADAIERLARQKAAAGDWAATKALIAEAVALPVDPNQHRQLQALAFALDYQGAAGPALRGYFFPGPSKIDAPTWALMAVLAEPTLGFAHYLLAFQRYAAGLHVEAARAFQRAIALGLPGQEFVRAAARRLAIASYKVGDIAGTSVAITVLSGAEMPLVDRLLAKDWDERLTFDATAATTSR
jgi:hypothetical protein